ncbi:MAG: adenylate/guanylate cyclase domain-containing protein [Elusimicrobia bacterium]|nr:adenylate/guanylate cyclase domain-containing protein [Elusimicrobiota bacterium]
MKKKTIGYLIGVSAILVILVLNFFCVFDLIEYKSYDFRLKLRGQKNPTGEIVIAAIDEESLDKLGRWPWDRSIHAKLIEKLISAGVRVVGFDVLFIEKSNRQSDDKLSNAMMKSQRCVNEILFEVVMGVPVKSKPPLEDIIKSSLLLGSPNIFPETDGVVRKMKPVIEYRGTLYPHISVAVASAYLNKPWQELVKNLSLDGHGEMLINYGGEFETFKYISYSRILAGDFNAELLKNKIVLIGYAAAGLGDRHVTPFSPAMPGIETIANNINSFINSDFISYPNAWAGFLSVVIVGLILTFFLPKLSPWKSTLLTIFIFISWSFICNYYFADKKIWLEYVPTASLVIFSYISITSWRFITEEKEKRWLKKAFGQYLSPLVINELQKNPDALTLGGKRQEMTVLFSDIRGFTTISEASTPEKVVALLNEYLTKMTEVVFKYEGTLDKFIGDAIMAFWNAPLPQNDHAKRAVFCAIDMMDELAKLHEKWRAEKRPVLDIGIGVNTGDMVVGNMGSVERMDYTVIGDNVNLGARLESLNKEFATHIIISESTYQYVKDFIKTKPLGTTKVKGKEKPVEIFEVIERQ